MQNKATANQEWESIEINTKSTNPKSYKPATAKAKNRNYHTTMEKTRTRNKLTRGRIEEIEGPSNTEGTEADSVNRSESGEQIRRLAPFLMVWYWAHLFGKRRHLDRRERKRDEKERGRKSYTPLSQLPIASYAEKAMSPRTNSCFMKNPS